MENTVFCNLTSEVAVICVICCSLEVNHWVPSTFTVRRFHVRQGHLGACWPLMFFQPSDFWLPYFNSFILFLIFFSSLGQLGHFGAVIQITFRTLGLTFFSGHKFEHGLYLMEIVKTQSVNSVVQLYSHLKHKTYSCSSKT